MFMLKPELYAVRKKHGLYVMIVTMKGREFGMSIHEWIQKGSVSDEIAKKRGLIELVRCKDCKCSEISELPYGEYYCLKYGYYHNGDWFCADGVKKE